MLPIPKRWVVLPTIPHEVDQELQQYPEVLRQLLYNRGQTTLEGAQRFLAAQPPPGTDPQNMLGISSAAERIHAAIHRGEQIAVYGDYDADGVTATALLVQFLRNLGARVRGYIPNRFDEGYGLNNDALSTLCADGVTLVITVDCGIRSIAEANHAQKIGLDLIITDHHHPADEIPIALAVINPKQPGDSYPDKNLAGVGLAYKLACGLAETSPVPLPEALGPDRFLDLVALGTIADMAPLTGENRALVKVGLEQIRRPQRQGIMSLIGVANLKREGITATDIGFTLGPRLNAAGRLESALAAYELLITAEVSTAASLAQQLDNQNRERQEITRQLQGMAEQMALESEPDPLILFAAHPNFNPGVVGLVASRLVEMHYRPAIVAHHGPEFTRASCRSINEFHITDALDECADLLEHHGGHAAAAGFTVRNENLPILMDRMKAIAQRELADKDLRPTLVADMEIPLKDLKPELLKYLERLQPTGQENKQPLFVTYGLKVRGARTVGKEGYHLKLAVTDGRITFDAIAFRQGAWANRMPASIDLMYHFETNEFNGMTTLQLNVRDIRPSGGDAASAYPINLQNGI